MAHLKAFGRFLFEATCLTVSSKSWFDDELFLRAAYRAFLKREPDESGRQYHLKMLRRKNTSRWNILRSITQSSEYRQIHGISIDALHQARMTLIQHYLPPAQTIVDLGGSAPGHPEGALLVMGYPHHPREITVIDLPLSQRLEGAKGAKPFQTFVTFDGVHVRYLYQSMADPLPMADESVDLVFSGESIEHVTEAEADAVCREAHRILKPGGYFCLDTPNALLTRIQSPNEFIHPEHKQEYYVCEMRAKIEQCGFEVVEVKGICPMPESLESGAFDYQELVRNVSLSDEPEKGYLFYLKAKKPACS